MNKQEKLAKLIDDKEHLKALTAEYTKGRAQAIDFEVTLEEEPENYVRERYTGRGHRFYNAKQGIMSEMKAKLKTMVPPHLKNRLEKLFKSETAIYYVNIFVDFYVKIPKADSVDTTILKEKKVILPDQTPDLDNYIKLLVDVLHEVAYDDDKRVTHFTTSKFYSVRPRTELKVRIDVIKE
jgi:Holliday junction resolvase RusA-like endonuclease